MVIWVLIWVSARNAFPARGELDATNIYCAKEDHRSYRGNYCSCEKESLKKFRLFSQALFPQLQKLRL